MANAVAFSFRNETVSYNGVEVTGFFTGDDAVTLTPNKVLIDTIVGADGRGIFNLGADRSAKLTLKLLSSSPFNDIFGADYVKNANGIFTPGLIYIKSTYGTLLASGVFAVTSFPQDLRLGEKDAGRTWTLETPELTIFPGMSAQIVDVGA